ncbi:anthrone oxygenase family protein [Nocardia salmonicida]|uniref:anthrone oxygenase family protein n=1 Tax=Nocardia salmonicida TaxID=53431 RepID=UPI0007A40CED|nr:anthrone oxygenase family protein [Nocardia salmonicida]
MFAVRMATMVLALLSTGLIAGVFYAYAISVMPALARTDDRTLIDVMQKINVVIINPWFMFGFMGTVGFTALAAALHLGKEQRSTLIWIGIALALNVIAFTVTAGLNVPLNDALAAAGDPASIADTAAVRADFEATWVRWNIVRAVVHTAAFLVLCGALFAAGVQQGKSSSSADVAAGQSFSQGQSFAQVGGPVAGQQFAQQSGSPIAGAPYGSQHQRR